ncbi:MAG: potassium-transporting ATPase subunit KdpC [Acidimicrobiia bacterium]|nr:potassium-transporting ATPase subunit KdpC [Acidimicrobiia bacterium]
MRLQLFPALRMLLVMTVVCGAAYTGTVTVLAQGIFEWRADGSLIEDDGEPVGSRLLGQPFAGRGYFHSRPSAVDYDPRLSGATNYGPNHPELLEKIAKRAESYRQANGLGPGTQVPVDAVTASASGLDPDISVANARLQAPRVAAERAISLDRVLAIIEAQRTSLPVGYRSDPSINVLALNLALDDM